MSEYDDEEAVASHDDLVAVGAKVVEMADRVRAMEPMAPGCAASWNFECEGMTFNVILKVAK